MYWGKLPPPPNLINFMILTVVVLAEKFNLRK